MISTTTRDSKVLALLEKQGRLHEPKSRAGGQGQWWNWPTRRFGRSSNPQTARKRQKKQSVTDRPTDQPTDRQTDRAGHRVACTRLKISDQIEALQISKLAVQTAFL